MESNSQVNLSGFEVGEDNIFRGNRIHGDLREVALGVNKAEKEERDARLAAYFASIDHDI